MSIKTLTHNVSNAVKKCLLYLHPPTLRREDKYTKSSQPELQAKRNGTTIIIILLYKYIHIHTHTPTYM